MSTRTTISQTLLPWDLAFRDGQLVLSFFLQRLGYINEDFYDYHIFISFRLAVYLVSLDMYFFLIIYIYSQSLLS